MSKPHEQWTVLPHGQLTEIDDGILTVVGEIEMPLMTFPRRMTVVRLGNARLLVYSAIALAAPEMERIEAMGRPAFLIVPNDHHRLDAKVWKARYPLMEVVSPAGARANIANVVPVDSTAPVLDDPDVDVVSVPGTRDLELAVVVRRRSGATLIVNDVIANIQHSTGFGGWLQRLMGFAGDEAHIPGPVKLSMVKDTGALRAQLMTWAEMANLRRVIVSHGDPIDSNPRQVLHDLANKLG